MAILPPRILNANLNSLEATEFWTTDDGTGDPWVGAPYRWSVKLDVTAQTHSSPFTPTYYQYNATDIVVGDWMADVQTGFAVCVVSIEEADGATITCTVEDVDRFNTFTDPSGNGYGIGNAGQWVIFSLGDDGLPIMGPLSGQNGALVLNAAFQLDQISRFRYRNYLRTHQAIHQPGHGFSIGDLIRMKADGTYVKALPTMAVGSLVGSVSDIGIPGADWFSYRPVGRIDQNVQPALPGNPGDLVYIALDGTLTVTKPNAWAKPVYLRLETENKAIVLDRSVEGVGTQGYSSQIYVVSSLAARNALTGLNMGDQAFVQDMGNGEWSHYIYETGGTWNLLVTQDASDTDSYSKQVNITFGSDPSGIIAVVSDGRRVDEVIVEVTTAFNGTASLTVGDSSGRSCLMSADQNDLSVVGNYKIDPAHIYNTNGVDTQVKYYLSTSNCTTGAATVSVTYS